MCWQRCTTVQRVQIEASSLGYRNWEGILTVASAFYTAAHEEELSQCRSVTNKHDKLANVLPELHAEAEKQLNQYPVVICEIQSAKSREAISSTCADVTNEKVCNLLSNVEGFPELASFVGDYVTEEQERVVGALDSECTRMHSALKSPVTPDLNPSLRP